MERSADIQMEWGGQMPRKDWIVPCTRAVRAAIGRVASRLAVRGPLLCTRCVPASAADFGFQIGF